MLENRENRRQINKMRVVHGGLDIVIGFRNILGVRGLGADIRGGWFFPGDAFRSDNGGGTTRDADTGLRIVGKFFF